MMQFTFDLPHRTAFSRSDFLVSDSNAVAVGWIDRWPEWLCPALALYGPAGCGKTHLVHLWSAQASSVIVSGETLSEELAARLVSEQRYRVAIDDADRASERALLHLYKLCLENRGDVLLAARRPPASWTVALPDLDSRLRAVLAVGIELPDDALLGAVLVKQFVDRQLHVAPDVIAYLITHMERSFAAAADTTARLDSLSLSDRRTITVPLARRVLTEAGAYSSPSARDPGVI
jgi:chromosomal replication initiation ATPase DnaA